MYGVYIHIPFCISKCKYCDFSSFPDKISLQDEYVDVLVAEIGKRKGLHADTVYIGGGTPSVLSEENIKKLLCAVNNNFVLEKDAEFTVEVNPATADINKALLMKENGVNRISMGAQSFVDSELKRIGRIHDADDIRKTFEILRTAGIGNISLDLMYALPQQTLETLEYSVSEAVKLCPEHISCYGLKFEEGTPLQKELESGIISEQDEEVFADMYELIRDKLQENGYLHYEISNFSKAGFESRHNLKYWQNKDYIGFGVAASSREKNRRYTYTSVFSDYMTSRALEEDCVMDEDEQMREFVILGLRMTKTGADKTSFEKQFGKSMDKVFATEIQKTAKYTVNTEKSLVLRDEYLLLSNAVMCEFI